MHRVGFTVETLYHTFKYNRLPEDELSGSKHVEGIKNQNINIEKVHFISLYCINILQCTVQKKSIKFVPFT